MENQQLKQAGLKITVPRVKILAILERSKKRHLSAEDVYKTLLKDHEEIGLATVYRVLTQFETAGLVCRRNFESGQSVFELNNGIHHDHLLCVNCDRVVEFTDPVIEERQTRIAEQYGFAIADHTLVIYGTCTNCQNKTAQDKS
ncbi:ferric iron uptake transcriptional regulator [Chromatium okenii]|uniref:ferric iron uptake transcriptional regulator n=1 Tax=Chromatium okenii TaxID=61644 RepID=UPI0019035866|nr:ferric iron uptake transcriptional regulator [Chromatium okenii]MBK1640468.1 ferric iron uptake transcriptional regulator [Chromatium okenii]